MRNHGLTADEVADCVRRHATIVHRRGFGGYEEHLRITPLVEAMFFEAMQNGYMTHRSRTLATADAIWFLWTERADKPYAVITDGKKHSSVKVDLIGCSYRFTKEALREIASWFTSIVIPKSAMLWPSGTRVEAHGLTREQARDAMRLLLDAETRPVRFEED